MVRKQQGYNQTESQLLLHPVHNLATNSSLCSLFYICTNSTKLTTIVPIEMYTFCLIQRNNSIIHSYPCRSLPTIPLLPHTLLFSYNDPTVVINKWPLKLRRKIKVVGYTKSCKKKSTGEIHP